MRGSKFRPAGVIPSVDRIAAGDPGNLKIDTALLCPPSGRNSDRMWVEAALKVKCRISPSPFTGQIDNVATSARRQLPPNFTITGGGDVSSAVRISTFRKHPSVEEFSCRAHRAGPNYRAISIPLDQHFGGSRWMLYEESVTIRQLRNLSGR